MMLSRAAVCAQTQRQVVGAAFPNWHTPLQALPRKAGLAARRHRQESVLAARRIHPYEEQKLSIFSARSSFPATLVEQLVGFKGIRD